MNTYRVYKHTCPDGQVYIGITSQDPPEKRWANGTGYKNSWFGRMGIKRFGWNNIQHEILYTGLTKEEAEEKEVELILEYESWCPGKGFNDRIGVKHNKTFPIKVVDLNMVFVSSKRCAEYLGISATTVYNAVNYNPGKKRKCGHTFEYATADNCSFSDVCIV